MSGETVTLPEPLTREEIERILEWTEGDTAAEKCDPDNEGICVLCNARSKLRAALDQPNQGEARTEYRVATTCEDGVCFETVTLRDLDEAERHVELRRSIYPQWESRIQLRTVTTSEWADLSEETER
jgi:hypothetical protein